MNTKMPNVHFAVQVANDILDMADEIHRLRDENAELRDYKQQYIELLNESIAHGQTMMLGFLDLSMKPGVMDAIAQSNELVQA